MAKVESCHMLVRVSVRAILMHFSWRGVGGWGGGSAWEVEVSMGHTVIVMS